MGQREGAVDALTLDAAAPPQAAREQAGEQATPRCRHCAAPLRRPILDLGRTPLANAFPTPEQAAAGPDASWPLRVRLCHACLLVQADDAVPPEAIFSDYAYFSSVSPGWVAHAARFAATAIQRFGLSERSLVLELASNDGYLLRHFAAAGIPVLGVEPAANIAAVARAAGIATECAFFDARLGRELAARGRRADLVVGNNVLAHVPRPADFLRGVAAVLAPEGVASFEFPHLARLLELAQFDTIYHEHLSYLSLLALERLLHTAGLRAFDVAELPTHGGSLRVLACHAAAGFAPQPGLRRVRQAEQAARLDRSETYAGLPARVAAIQRALRDFLRVARAQGRRVAAYGAAAKGCTLLNTAGVTAQDIACVADRSPAKQGHLLPGCRIRIVPPEALRRQRVDAVLILPWNLADEIAAELADLAAAGTGLWVALPQLRRV